MMRNTLRLPLAFKLWLVLFLSSSLLVAGSLFWLHISLDDGFKAYLKRKYQAQVEVLQPLLEDYYTEQHSWDGLQSNLYLWRDFKKQAWLAIEDDISLPKPSKFDGERDLGPPPPPRERLRPERPHKFKGHLILADNQKQQLIGPHNRFEGESYWTPLKVDGQHVGYVGFVLPSKIKSHREASFLQQQQQNFIVIGAFALTISVIFALPLAAILTRPIRQLEASTKALTRGELSTRVDRIGNDELGDLATHFNELAKTLEANEQSRRQWVADISHELRTPITFVKGQIEAFIDGVRPTNAKNLNALLAQINHLGQLVNDLYELSLTELGGLRYQKVWQPVAPLIEQAIEQTSAAMNDKGLECLYDPPAPDDLILLVDSARITQLLNNLLANSLRYTDSPGQIKVSCQVQAQWLQLTIDDTAPGVTDNDLPRLFDRLYRADPSRNSQTGGRGLGLALCKNIVGAHSGQIRAAHSDMGGLQIIVNLPIGR